ncbi:hypothetical protein SPRG_14089, partial [Saprolegnia parasitica CBS 223.65]
MALKHDDAAVVDAPAIDVARDRFPFCIVWSPLPVITWFLPFIGHMGIGDSHGVIYDFAGPYHIGEDHFAFGRPTRYLRLSLPESLSADDWDDGVRAGCAIYRKRMHNICCDNCHSHVARCLESMGFPRPSGGWNMIYLCFYMLCCGSFVNAKGALLTWGPFLALVAIAILWHVVA